MTIECYRSDCRFHSFNDPSDGYDGPLCYENECRYIPPCSDPLWQPDDPIYPARPAQRIKSYADWLKEQDDDVR